MEDYAPFFLFNELMSQPHFGLSVRVRPTLPKVEVLQDSRKLRARLQGSNLLAFEHSLCHWKGLEV
jgi:hypothetical protein